MTRKPDSTSSRPCAGRCGDGTEAEPDLLLRSRHGEDAVRQGAQRQALPQSISALRMRAGNACPASNCSIRCDHTVGTSRRGASASAKRRSARASRTVEAAHRLCRSDRLLLKATRSPLVSGGTGGSRSETAAAHCATSCSPAGRSAGSSGGSTARSSASSRRSRRGAMSVIVNPSNQSLIAASSMTSIGALVSHRLVEHSREARNG